MSTKPKPPASHKPKRRNHASAQNGKLGGGVVKTNHLEGLTNLETGEPSVYQVTRFGSLKAASSALKVALPILRDARDKGCNAFESSGSVHRERLILWLKEHGPKGETLHPQSAGDTTPEEEFTENYNIPDEAGGVGQTLKSLQAYERRLKRLLDEAEKSTQLHPAVKAEKVKEAQAAWLKVANSLLKYDLAVDLAKRESGELLPMADAVKAVQALLAWHTVAVSDALRNVIPELEGRNKYEIATLLDPALRASIYRNFKLGAKLGKIPEWMSREATDFIKGEAPLSLDKVSVSTNLDDY